MICRNCRKDILVEGQSCSIGPFNSKCEPGGNTPEREPQVGFSGCPYVNCESVIECKRKEICKHHYREAIAIPAANAGSNEARCEHGVSRDSSVVICKKCVATPEAVGPQDSPIDDVLEAIDDYYAETMVAETQGVMTYVQVRKQKVRELLASYSKQSQPPKLMCGNCAGGECITGDHDCNKVKCQCPNQWCVETRKELKIAEAQPQSGAEDIRKLLSEYRLAVICEEADLAKSPNLTRWTSKRQELEEQLLRNRK